MSFKSSSSGGSIAPPKMESANLLVKGFPSTIRESELQEVFLHYGNNTCKLVSGLAFVSYANIMDAYNATTALHGRNGLQVIPLPAMSDGGPEEGQEPDASDNLYVLHIPVHWTEAELVELFTPYGTVRQCRIFQVLNRSNCGSALVRMNNLAAARKAIQGLNGRFPVRRVGEIQQMPLVVRYADSPEEKARKKQRKEQLANLQQRILLESPYAGMQMPLEQQLATEFLQQAVGQLKLSGGPHPGKPGDLTPHAFGTAPLVGYPYDASLKGGAQSAFLPQGLQTMAGATAGAVPPAAALFNQGAGRNPYPLLETPTTVYISNIPQEADNLWVYKRFAPHGPITDVQFKTEAGECCSVTYMNQQSAFKAIQSVDLSGKDPLQVTLHKPPRKGL